MDGNAGATQVSVTTMQSQVEPPVLATHDDDDILNVGNEAATTAMIADEDKRREETVPLRS